MSKYILDLEPIEGTNLYKAKGFNSLVFDEEGIRRLEKYEENESESIGFADDEICLLSTEEYEKYRDKIPYINTWWWLRSSGDCSSNAADVYGGGSVNNIGHNVRIGNEAMRPALKYSKLKSKIITSEIRKDRFIFNDFPFLIIDEKSEIAIAEVPITFDKFDADSNDYESSYVREWLLNWL